MTRRRWLVALTVLALAMAGVVAWQQRARPVDLAVIDAPAEDLPDLLDRSDLVVVGHVVEVAGGRVLSDPADPTRAVHTQLAQLQVDEVTVGRAPGRLVLEEVAALADGTRATVEGQRPSQVGDAGLYFLVRGEDGRVAPVGPQGRYLLDPDDPDRLVPPLPGDRLATRLAALGPRRLRAAVLDTASERRPPTAARALR